MFQYPKADTTGSVGRPLPNLDLKLIDDDGKDITGYGIRGELCIRGPTVVKGYFENPEANSRDWDSDNYFHTGKSANKRFPDGIIQQRGAEVVPEILETVQSSRYPDQLENR